MFFYAKCISYLLFFTKILTLCFRGRVFSLDFGAMRVCDLEFDRVRRLTTPASPLPVPTTNPNPNPSCHTVWKYYCRDNFGWREYSEVSHFCVCLVACTLYEHEARHINFAHTNQSSSHCDGINLNPLKHAHTHLKTPCHTVVYSQVQFMTTNQSRLDILWPCEFMSKHETRNQLGLLLSERYTTHLLMFPGPKSSFLLPLNKNAQQSTLEYEKQTD